MGKLKEIAKKLPVLPFVYRALRNEYGRYQMRSNNTEKVFTWIYRSDAWGGKYSRSGPGSTVDQTRVITKELSSLINDFNISNMLDIPCGDFYWMKNVNLGNVDYTGADIVKKLIQECTKRYGSDGIRFRHMNLTQDQLPQVDLVFCRDCLVHFSFADIFLALANVCNSQSKYILTTTFTGRKVNDDIATGEWRVLNLEIAPFFLPEPLKLIVERCTEGDGIFEDKGLGFWRISDIRKSLAERNVAGLIGSERPLSAKADDRVREFRQFAI